MPSFGKQLQIGVVLTVISVWPFASAQTNKNLHWDPIAGWVDGNEVTSNNDASFSRSGTGSPWSFPQALDSDPTGFYQRPATIGGISSSSAGRHCGGLFRMTKC